VGFTRKVPLILGLVERIQVPEVQGGHDRIALKVINHLGDEVMKVFRIE